MFRDGNYNVWDKKSKPDRNNSRLDTTKEKISELEEIAIETILNKSQRETKTGGKNRALKSCGSTSSILIHR